MGDSDHAVTELKAKEARQQENKETELQESKQTLTNAGNLVGRILWEASLIGKGIQESLLSVGYMKSMSIHEHQAVLLLKVLVPWIYHPF